MLMGSRYIQTKIFGAEDSPLNVVSGNVEANVSLIQGKPGGRGPSGKEGQKGAKVS